MNDFLKHYFEYVEIVFGMNNGGFPAKEQEDDDEEEEEEEEEKKGRKQRNAGDDHISLRWSAVTRSLSQVNAIFVVVASVLLAFSSLLSFASCLFFSLDLTLHLDPLPFRQRSSEAEQKAKAAQLQREKLQEACSKFQLAQHEFQEYTYKKVTPCEVCSQILRGHLRQGLRCKKCKINVHANECQDRAPKCQPPKSRILRRQKSTSELETNRLSTRFDDLNSNGSTITSTGNRDDLTPASSNTSIDPVYLMLRAAVEARRNNTPPINPERKFYGIVQRARASHASNLLTVNNLAAQSSCSAPHSPQRKKMSLRMKSFSLDESNPSTQHPIVHLPAPSTSSASTSAVIAQLHPLPLQQQPPAQTSIQLQQQHALHQSMIATTSTSLVQPLPVNQQLLNAKPTSQSMRKMFGKAKMNSLEVHNSTDKSSTSTSPCPSPIVQMKPQRLLPTNLYVVLYNFRCRHEDEISLNAGATITVTDTSDRDWWKGKYYGKTGFFPSKYVTRLFSGERPLQMTHTIEVPAVGNEIIKLIRDQIVIQVSEEELNGMIKVRTGTSDAIVSCPLQYTKEI